MLVRIVVDFQLQIYHIFFNLQVFLKNFLRKGIFVYKKFYKLSANSSGLSDLVLSRACLSCHS